MLRMFKLAVVSRTIFPDLSRIVINLFQRITFILPVDIFHTDFQCLFLKQRCRIIDLPGVFYGRGIIDIPFRIFSGQIVITFLHIDLRTSLIVIRRLAKAIRQRQQFIFFAGRMLEIDIDIRRTERTL